MIILTLADGKATVALTRHPHRLPLRPARLATRPMPATVSRVRRGFHIPTRLQAPACQGTVDTGMVATPTLLHQWRLD